MSPSAQHQGKIFNARTPDHAKFLANVDWAATSVGDPLTWPDQLCQAVDFVLVDPTPAAVMWGDRLTVSKIVLNWKEPVASSSNEDCGISSGFVFISGI